MAHLLIDGYNLIGIAHRDLEKARNSLVEKLAKYSALKGHDITVVYDGWRDGHGTETRKRISNVTVIYSRIGDKADNVIKRIISQGNLPWIVVSSDREISDYAFNKGCAPVASGDFESKLDAAVTESGRDRQKGKAGYDDEDLEEEPSFHKGNPQRLSKKQKITLQALKKL